MRLLIAMFVLLATVGTVMVGVRQQGENRRLEYRVWETMRRRDGLTKQVRELETAIEALLAPKRLLEEKERRLAIARQGGEEHAE